MSELMYKEDREPLMVTDDKDGRAVMRKNGWSDQAPEAPKPEVKAETKKSSKKGGK